MALLHRAGNFRFGKHNLAAATVVELFRRQRYHESMFRAATFVVVLCFSQASWAEVNTSGFILAVPNSVRTVLVAETDSATLYHFAVEQDELTLVNEHRMSIGQNGVAKQRSGDRRTPLGVYFVIERLDTRNLHEKYGPVAFPLDYPNAWDRRNERTGHGIWIHGVTPDSGPRPVRDTDGCISLQNEELMALGGFIDPLHTPVIVARELSSRSKTETELLKAELFAALDDWSESYRKGDWHAYMSLYGKDFSHRGMSRDEWFAYRLQTQSDRVIAGFSIDDVYLISDPDNPGLFLSRFRQHVVEKARDHVTVKRLYWQRENGEFRIVAEDNG